MLSDVIKACRKINNLSQEEVASKLDVSRQALAKWENGSSVPDIYNCQKLCELYGITISELLESDKNDYKMIQPRDKFFFGIVKIGENNEIKLTNECLSQMGYKKGDTLVCLGDLYSGIALCPTKNYEKFAEEIIKNKEQNNGNY